MSVIFSFYAVFGRTMERMIARDRLFEHVASRHMTKGQTTFDGQWWREAAGAGGRLDIFSGQFFFIVYFLCIQFFLLQKVKKRGLGGDKKKKELQIKKYLPPGIFGKLNFALAIQTSVKFTNFAELCLHYYKRHDSQT